MRNRHSRVEHWDNERHLGNGHIVTLRPGFAFHPAPDEGSALHIMGFDTVREAMDAIRHLARPCHCERCKRGA